MNPIKKGLNLKCLSICQPFADLIIQKKKIIELRNWNTKFRGEFLIHSPKKIRLEDYKRLGYETKLISGAIVGIVEIFDVKRYQTQSELDRDYTKHLSKTKIGNGKYGFCLRNAKPIRIPIPYNGALGFFDFNTNKKVSDNKIILDLMDEEFRYQWIGRH